MILLQIPSFISIFNSFALAFRFLYKISNTSNSMATMVPTTTLAILWELSAVVDWISVVFTRVMVEAVGVAVGVVVDAVVVAVVETVVVVDRVV